MKKIIIIALIALAATPPLGTISPSPGSSYPDELVTFTTIYSDTDGYIDIKTA